MLGDFDPRVSTSPHHGYEVGRHYQWPNARDLNIQYDSMRTPIHRISQTKVYSHTLDASLIH